MAGVKPRVLLIHPGAGPKESAVDSLWPSYHRLSGWTGCTVAAVAIALGGCAKSACRHRRPHAEEKPDTQLVRLLSRNGDYADDIMAQCERDQRFPLGMALDIDEGREGNRPEHEVFVRRVEKDSPAYRAGILPGDRISVLGMMATTNAASFMLAYDRLTRPLRAPSRKHVQIGVMRGSQSLRFRVQLRPLPPVHRLRFYGESVRGQLSGAPASPRSMAVLVEETRTNANGTVTTTVIMDSEHQWTNVPILKLPE